MGKEEIKQSNFEGHENDRGSLGMTAEDHKRIGSTPPDELLENPGKTEGELMADAEVVEWKERQEKGLRDLEDLAHRKDIPPHIFLDQKANYERNLEYLMSIGRLPKESKD